jgi:hypothetical protein
MKSIWYYLRYAFAALLLYAVFGFTEHSSLRQLVSGS